MSNAQTLYVVFIFCQVLSMPPTDADNVENEGITGILTPCRDPATGATDPEYEQSVEVVDTIGR